MWAKHFRRVFSIDEGLPRRFCRYTRRRERPLCARIKFLIFSVLSRSSVDYKSMILVIHRNGDGFLYFRPTALLRLTISRVENNYFRRNTELIGHWKSVTQSHNSSYYSVPGAQTWENISRLYWHACNKLVFTSICSFSIEDYCNPMCNDGLNSCHLLDNHSLTKSVINRKMNIN